MAITTDDIEMLWMEEVLDMHGEFLVDLFVEDIEAKGLKDTEALIESVEQYKVMKEGMARKLVHTFKSYGRAIEINYHKKADRGQNLNQDIWGIKQNRPKKKNTLWYSKNAYGSLNRLISIIQNELGDEEKIRLKRILQYQQERLLA